MTKITNKQGVNELLVNAVRVAMNSHVSHAEGGYYASVTELLNEPQQVLLRRRHADEIERDVLECIDLFIGTAVHEFIHNARGDYKGLSEERFKCEVLGKIVSGGMDDGILVIRDMIIEDFKVVKSFSAGLDSSKPKWEAQLNMYGYMATLDGYTVKGLAIVPIVKDYPLKEYGKPLAGKPIRGWGKEKGQVVGHYPPAQVYRIPLEVWAKEKTLAFMEEKVSKLVEAEPESDKALSFKFPCQDTWGGRRCKDYCDVAEFCHQAKGGKK